MEWNPAVIFVVATLAVVALLVMGVLVKFMVIDPISDRLAPEAEHERIQRETHALVVDQAHALGIDVPKRATTAHVRDLIGQHNRRLARASSQD